MKQELKVLVLNSKFLNLSIEDLKSNTNVPVEWHVEDSSNKENIRKLLPNFNILVSTSMDISWKNEAKNLKNQNDKIPNNTEKIILQAEKYLKKID